MADFLNRTTLELAESASPDTEYPPAEWVKNPDLSAVAGQPSRYWKLTGDVVSLQTAGEQAATDAAIAAAALVTNRDEAKAPVAATDGDGVRVRALIELFNKRDNYLATRLGELNDRVQAMIDSSGNVGNMRADGAAVSVSPINTRPRAAAVSDFRASIDAGNSDAGE